MDFVFALNRLVSLFAVLYLVLVRDRGCLLLGIRETPNDYTVDDIKVSATLTQDRHD